jgi:AAA family ATP:ADP antiporter
MIASLLGTALYILMAQLVEPGIPNVDDRVKFFADVNNATNALALVIQLLIVMRVVHRFGIGVSLSLLPIASVIGFVVLAIDPVLGVVTVFTVLRRALGFGFSKPTSDMLYSVVTPEEKYKTKNFIDTAVYRSGDVIAALALRALAAIGLGMAAISIVMLPFAALWASLSIWLGRDYRRRAKQLRESEAR